METPTPSTATTPSTTAPAVAQPPQNGQVTLDQAIEGLQACLDIIGGKCDEKRERQLRGQIAIGEGVIKAIVERKLLLISPQQIQQPNRAQRRGQKAAARARSSKA